MRTSDQTSTFKVYRSDTDHIYDSIEKDKIESAFIEYAKINHDLKFGNFKVNYQPDANNNIKFEFEQMANSSPDAREFSIYNTDSPPSRLMVSENFNENLKIIKIKQALIKFVEENDRLPNKDLDLTVREGVYHVEENSDLAPNLDLSAIKITEGSSSHTIGATTQQLLKEIAIKKAFKTLYKAKPTLTTTEAIIDVDKNGKYVARELDFFEQFRLINGTLDDEEKKFCAKITPDEQNTIKTEIEAEKLNDDLNTISSFFATPDANVELSDQSSTLENADKIKKSLTRVLSTVNVDNPINETLNEYFISSVKLATKNNPSKVDEVLKTLKTLNPNDSFFDDYENDSALKTKKQSLLVINSYNLIKEILEVGYNEDIKTISSFFATPDANTESSDQTSTTENENKIKELLTRVLTTDEKETESEKTFNEKLKAYFVQMAKADMEKSFKSGKPSKFEDLIKGFGNDEATKGLIYEAINEEDIKTISSFFATPDANPESSDQTSTTENENKIKELLTRVSSTADFNNPINKKLKKHFFLSVELATKNNQSKVTKVLGILDLLIKDESKDTSINFAILRNQIKDEVEKTTRKEAEEKAKKEAEENAKREEVENAIRKAEAENNTISILKSAKNIRRSTDEINSLIPITPPENEDLAKNDHDQNRKEKSMIELIESMIDLKESLNISTEYMKKITLASNKESITSFFTHLDNNSSDNEVIKKLLTAPSEHRDEYITHFFNLAQSHIEEEKDPSKIYKILEISDDNEEIGILLKDKINNFFKELELKVGELELELELDKELQESEDAIVALELEYPATEKLNSELALTTTPPQRYSLHMPDNFSKRLGNLFFTSDTSPRTEYIFFPRKFDPQEEDILNKEIYENKLLLNFQRFLKENSTIPGISYFLVMAYNQIESSKKEEFKHDYMFNYTETKIQIGNTPFRFSFFQHKENNTIFFATADKKIVFSPADIFSDENLIETTTEINNRFLKKKAYILSAPDELMMIIEYFDYLASIESIEKKLNEPIEDDELKEELRIFKLSIPDLTKKVKKLLKKDIDNLDKFKELLNKIPENSDTHKEANLLLKKSQNELFIDTFFEGSTLPIKIRKIKQEISADPESMEYFRKKLETCSKKIKLLRTSHTYTQEENGKILTKIITFRSIKNTAQGILTSAENIVEIDDFFKGPHQGELPEETKTNIKKNILTDPELMEYFKKKLAACSETIESSLLLCKKTSQTKAERENIIVKIRTCTSIEKSAQEILYSAQKKIKKTTKLVGDVFHSISSSGRQAPETLAGGTEASTASIGGAEEEKNVHAINVFLSQLKSAIDKGKSGVEETQPDQNIEKIKDAFSKSFPSDDSDPSKKFKIEFFNALVDTLNNDEFIENKSFLNFRREEQEQQKLFESFSQAFNGKTIGALNALSDSIKTHEDHKLSTIVFRGKKDLYIQSENGGEIEQSKNLVYSTIFSSLFFASKKRLESPTSAPASASASADNSSAPAPASTAGSAWAEASGNHSPPL